MAGRIPHRDEHTASEEQPRGDAGPLPNAPPSDEDDDGDKAEYDDTVFEDDHIIVREHLLIDDNTEVAVGVGRDPNNTRPTIVDACELRDALDEYLDGSEATVENDRQLTVEGDADVSAASDAIESLQTDTETLTEELNEAAERVEDIDIGSLDFGLPAPSPSDVQAEMSETETDQVWVPAEPLYELARMWAGIPASEPSSYRQGRKEAGEWLIEELDELTGETDE